MDRVFDVLENVTSHLTDNKFRRVKLGKLQRQACIAANGGIIDDDNNNNNNNNNNFAYEGNSGSGGRKPDYQVHYAETLFTALGWKVCVEEDRK